MSQMSGQGQSRARITSRRAAELVGIHPLKQLISDLPKLNQEEREREDEIVQLQNGTKLAVWRSADQSWHFLIYGDPTILQRLVAGGNA